MGSAVGLLSEEMSRNDIAENYGEGFEYASVKLDALRSKYV